MGELRNRPTKLMRARAQSLRKAMTDEETMLWYELRELKEVGHIFRKQVPIGKYVADFACLNSKLIIKLTASSTQTPNTCKQIKFGING